MFALRLGSLLHQLRCENQVNAVRCELRDAIGESGDGGGPWVADGDGEAVAAGVASGEFELFENGFARCDVVEENFARRGAHAVGSALS